ncbi:MAG: ATP-binding cassette domain-containing protein, partial [Oscillospiraceae bacterium]
MIQIKNLSKVFSGKEDVQALENINIDILKTDICGIIGMSGAGKSTLLRCMALLDKPTSGSIIIDGNDISSLKGKDLIEHRKQIGVIFQGYHLLMQRTVYQNIAFPLELNYDSKEKIHEKVVQLLSLVGL